MRRKCPDKVATMDDFVLLAALFFALWNLIGACNVILRRDPLQFMNSVCI